MPLAKFQGGGKIHYEVFGRGAPVFLIAGIGGTANYWKPQIDYFARKYNVILHDHRGTGRSSKDRIKYSVPQMTDDVVLLMDHLELASAYIVGHSTGAAIAQDMAIRYPDRIAAAVYYAGWVRPDDYFKRVFDIRSELLVKSGPLAYVKTTPLFLCPPSWINEHFAVLAAEEADATAAFPPTEIMLSRIEAICTFGLGEELRTIRRPGLITCARDDQLTPLYCSEEMAKLIPHADTFYFDWGGHAVSQTAPDEFNSVITSYLDATIENRPWPSARQGARSNRDSARSQSRLR